MTTAKTDRITRLDGTFIADDLTPDEARRQHARLRESGVGHIWERYCGPRTGWNSVRLEEGEAITA